MQVDKLGKMIKQNQRVKIVAPRRTVPRRPVKTTKTLKKGLKKGRIKNR